MSDQFETSEELWREHAQWASAQKSHTDTLESHYAAAAENEGRSRSPWVAEVLGDAPGQKLRAIAERMATTHGPRHAAHAELAAESGRTITRTEERSASGIERAVDDVGHKPAPPASTRIAGTGFAGPGAPFPGREREQRPQAAPNGGKLAPAPPSTYTSAAPTDAHGRPPAPPGEKVTPAAPNGGKLAPAPPSTYTSAAPTDAHGHKTS